MEINQHLEKFKDPKFYLENFTSIKGKKPGALVPFVLNEAQKDLFQDVINNRKTEVDALNGILCRYARQSGVLADSHVTVYELIKSLEKEVDTVNIKKERF